MCTSCKHVFLLDISGILNVLIPVFIFLSYILRHENPAGIFILQIYKRSLHKK